MGRKREGRGEHKRKRGKNGIHLSSILSLAYQWIITIDQGRWGRAGRITVNLSLINLSHNKGWGRRGEGFRKGGEGEST